MRKALYTLLVLVVLATVSSAQVYKDSWKLGFGGNYPRLVNTSLSTEIINYGVFFSLERSFSEHTSLRGKLKYNHMVGKYTSPVNLARIESTIDNIGADFDLVYTLMPCEKMSPFFYVGVGGVLFSTDKAYPKDADMEFEVELNLGIGGTLRVDDQWQLIADLGFHTLPTSSFDGRYADNVTSSMIGGNFDSYLDLSVGAVYEFSRGEKSKLCDLYSGLTAETNIDYDRIETIVKKYIPKEVVKEVVVEKEVASKGGNQGYAGGMVLYGVNFEFNSSKLTPESYPVLFHALQILSANPDMKVEIQGYTDNIGSESYNKQVSQKRAEVVKNYLVAKGVAASRLTAVGYGEANPIADNKTASGRAMNRRIEFKQK